MSNPKGIEKLKEIEIAIEKLEAWNNSANYNA